MIGRWTAPVAAAAFAGGAGLAGWIRLGPAAWALLATGALLLLASFLTTRGLDRVDPFARAGVLPAAGSSRAVPEDDRRERILAAVRAPAPLEGEGARDDRGRMAALRPLPSRRLWAATASAVAGILLLGSGWAGIRGSGAERSTLLALAGRPVEVVLTMGSDPSSGPFGWSARATAERLEVGGTTVAIREPVWLEGNGPAPPLELGDRVVASGVAEAPLAGGFAEFLRSEGIGAIFRGDQVDRLGPPANPLVRAANVARRTLQRGIRDAFGARDAGLVLGLAVGDTSRLDPAVEEDFRASGLGHLLAVSGENVAMFLAPVFGLALLMGLGVRRRFALGAVATIFFVLLTRGEPSVLRAAVMVGLTLLAALLGRPRATGTVLGAAVLVLLVWDPGLVHSVGFQLSVAATAGMVALAGPIARRIPGPRILAVAAGATIGAQAGVTPLLLFHFHVAPMVGLPANVLAFPAVAPALLLALAAAAATVMWHPLGRPLAALAHVPVAYLIGLADRAASAPLPAMTSRGGVVPLVGGTVVVAWLAWRLRRTRANARRQERPDRLSTGHGRPNEKGKRETLGGAEPGPMSPARQGPRTRLPRAALVGLLIAGLVWSHAARAGPPSDLVVRFFDVGQGDAALIQSPGGANVLIDAGPDRDAVAVKLAALGVHRLDLVVATHAHADHVTGLPAVLARFPVGLVIDPGCPGDSPFYADFLRAVRAEGLPFQHPRPGQVLRVGDLRLEVLGPDACFSGTRSDPNNDSLVLRVSDGGDSVLFTGDVEEPAQEPLLAEEGDRLGAQILKVPHHGGDTNLPEFLVAPGAAVAIVSVGQPNPYGHPMPSVLATLRADGMRVYRTDRSGDVTVRFTDEGILVRSARAA